MLSTLRLEGVDYNVSTLPAQARAIVALIQTTDELIADRTKKMKVILTVRQQKLDELKTEIIQGKTGVDLGSLFSD